MKLIENFKKFMKDNKRIVKYFKPYWKIWLMILVIANFLTILTLINPLIVKFLIDTVLIEKNFKMLNLLMFAFIGIGMISVVVQYIYAEQQSKATSLNPIPGCPLPPQVSLQSHPARDRRNPS